MVMAKPTGPWRTANVVLAIFFPVAISLPLADSLLDLDPTPRQVENRPLAPRPELRLTRDSIEKFPPRFEAYFNDHFGFRRTLIMWHGLVKLGLLKAYYSDRVIIGKDGWLFFRLDKQIENYRCVHPYDEAELDQWVRLFEARRRRLAARGIRYLVVFVPNKHTIYSEKLPDGINRVHDYSRLDQLTARLAEHGGIPFLDLRGVLFEAKKRAQVYFKTDTHWNGAGRIVAARAILARIAEWFPAIKVPDPAELVFTNHRGKGGDLTRMMGIDQSIEERRPLYRPRVPRARRVELGRAVAATYWPPTYEPQAWEVDDPTLPRALVIGDSAAMSLVPELSEHFRRVSFIAHLFKPEFIEDEKPDVVINELGERFLTYELPDDVENTIDYRRRMPREPEKENAGDE